MAICLRKATVRDVKSIHAALVEAAALGLLLPRSLSQLYKHSREFLVLEDESRRFLGCAALSIIWEDLAEIRSLAVLEAIRGQGYGRMLVEACLREAAALKIPRVFVLTYQDVFFSRLGFVPVGKDTLPQKIWADCIHCVKFPDCDEIAMEISVPAAD